MAANLKFLLYAFKLAQLTSFESENSFELSLNSKTRLVRLILKITKEFLIGSHLWIGSILTKFIEFNERQFKYIWDESDTSETGR